MAGTISYDLSPLHTYQRRLMYTELLSALSNTHLYVVSRRPRTTVHRQGQALGASILHTTTRDSPSDGALQHSMSSVVQAEVLHDGAYWAGLVDGRRVHGEAWHLAALASDRDPRVCRHEVLYVGQAFGRTGARNVEDRTRSHSTLQRIYEEHHASEWDIFVTPLVVDDLHTENDDHIHDSEPGALGLWANLADGRRLEFAKTTVDVVEHMLIAYFRPTYNRRLLSWTRAKHLDAVRTDGYRLLSIQFHSLHALTQFFTASRASELTHSIAAEVPGISAPTGLTIGTWADVTSDGPLMPVARLRGAAQWIAQAAANSPGILKVFGDSGPTTNPDLSRWATDTT